ncbi:MAG: CbiX/SirB N-terminal domain-containing protein [Bacteroidota bacterium]|nr:CbiX/SirB N-terminal domain-containing protein [Bacteroidota bacterium]
MKTIALYLVILFGFISCNNQQTNKSAEIKDGIKTGVLIVSHGSHSTRWREMLLDIENSVEQEILKNPKISEVKSAFMEYEGPNIADQLKAFDRHGFDEIIVVPLFLTISSHTTNDLQNIVGISKNPEVVVRLKEEEIELYKPKAKIVITPLLDFPGFLKKNVARRYNAISKDTGNEGVVFVAYGSRLYTQQWVQLMNDLGKYLRLTADVENISYAWCGHIVDYSPQPVTNAVNQILDIEKSVVVIPILVAFDEMFQGDIIKKGIEAVEFNETKVLYKPDAILPDENLNKWVIDIVNSTLE